MLQICVLASGSGGNCTYVASPRTAVLVDAGLSARDTMRRLAAAGVATDTLQGILITHEHTDHTSGVPVLTRRYGLPLYANRGTIDGMERNPRMRNLPWNQFMTGTPFLIDDLTIEPFSVPHDCYDPVGFVIHAGGTRVGVVTDMGMTTTLIRERLRQCHALVIESNHDEELLMASDRPWTLKQRIRGSQGHLSNRHAADLISEVAGPELGDVFLAHVSAECNEPGVALECMREALNAKGLPHVSVHCTRQDRHGIVWRSGTFAAQDAPRVTAERMLDRLDVPAS